MQPQQPPTLPLSPLGSTTTLSPTPNTIIHYYKNPTILNQQYTHDIIPGVYQGGFQLWECQIQMIKKMFQLEELSKIIEGKVVAEIGCGHGLLAVAAHKLKAKQLVLQDYNQDVIQQLTKPTLTLNNVYCPVSYTHGDWQTLRLPSPVDIILGSELTYRQQNYSKIITFIMNNMKKTGKCILANKSYYFGVGGNLSDFKTLLEEKGLGWRSVVRIVPKTGGNKKEIIEIYFTESLLE